MAYQNSCAKSYSILFWRLSSSIFSNRVPNLRHEYLDVFSSEFFLTLLSKPFPVEQVSQKCTYFWIICWARLPVTCSYVLVQQWFSLEYYRVFGLLIIKRKFDCATLAAWETRFSNTSITAYTSHLSGVCRDMEWLTTVLYNLWLLIGALFSKIRLLSLNKLKTESCAGKGAPCLVRKITHLVHYHVVLSKLGKLTVEFPKNAISRAWTINFWT